MSDRAIKIEARGVCKRFIDPNLGHTVTAIQGLDLAIRDREFAVIIGPSGCGKSTFLYMAAGFEQPSDGQVLVGGHPVQGPGADRGIVFQDFVLYPWRTVLRNITLGLEVQGAPRDEARAKAMRWIQATGLKGFENVYPYQLSGGMKQRVAIARALAYDPEIILMDEPFGALDAQTKLHMSRDLQRVWAEADKTILFVTHSVKEALLLADRVFIFSQRPSHVQEILQVDLPRPRDPGDARLIELEQYLVRALESSVAQMLQG